MDKLNKLSLPAVILIGSIVLGGFYFASQANKQNSIERQQQIRIEQDKQEQLKEQETKAEAEQTMELIRQSCISDARNTLETNVVIDDEFCARCAGYDNSVLRNQCLDGCLDLRTKSLNKYEEAEKECFRRYPQK